MGVCFVAFGMGDGHGVATAAPQLHASLATAKRTALISPYWPDSVQRWASLIYKMSYVKGIDPDFVAAVVMAESSGNPIGVSYAGAVGLMGVMPSGPGLEFRPSSEELTDPHTNLSWGVAILTDIIQQSGGDVSAALAAYNGGWPNANRSVPQEYAAKVLDAYARALIAREGGNPEAALEWTVAIEMRRGHVPIDSLLVLGDSPRLGGAMYSPHVLYDYINEEGDSFYIKGYVVPLGRMIVEAVERELENVEVIAEPQAEKPVEKGTVKLEERNPRILLTCLATSTRLRNEDNHNTRWFSPSSCPEWRRP